ncbi:MAG: hypothetical protein ACE5R4_16205 [Armatimonadota bacterium]
MTGLVTLMDAYAPTREGLKVWVVMVADQGENEPKVKELAKAKELKIPITFLADGPTGRTATKQLKLNPDVKYTILAYNQKKVTANFAWNEITDEGLLKLKEAADAIAPPAEEEEEAAAEEEDADKDE